MKIKYFMIVSAFAALAACTNNPNNTSAPAQPVKTETSASTQTQANNLNSGDSRVFVCENGMTANVTYMIDEREDKENAIHLNVDTIGTSAHLTQKVSASGERYAADKGFYDKATEWHEKGGEAYFEFTDPYGNKTETTCNVKTK
ncbi:MliC family protein [Wielerella bovis]|uniref:MliC family protein n=1 Tax=Wielerella bovis TaxID=2917790 RepID=UPI00201A036B|nr:MliC family protein [Wielerella bovis]ULJ62688.1 MliC family protein [Wielerella bovis]